MGQRSFSDGPALTPSSFSAMPPHMQTEACLLAREAGFKLGSIAASVDEPVLFIKAIMETRHRHNPFGIERAISRSEVNDAVPGNSTRLMVLRHLAKMGAGVVDVTTAEIAEDLAIGVDGVNRAVRYLIGCDMLRRVRICKRDRKSQYQVTRLGRVAVEMDEAAP